MGKGVRVGESRCGKFFSFHRDRVVYIRASYYNRFLVEGYGSLSNIHFFRINSGKIQNSEITSGNDRKRVKNSGLWE